MNLLLHKDYVKQFFNAKFANSIDHALILNWYTTVEPSDNKGFRFAF